MSDLTLYGYSKCSTCKKAQAWLEEAGWSYTFVDITTSPPARIVLEEIVAGGYCSLSKLYNTSGQAYREGGYKELKRTLGHREQFEALAANGRLIKRPLVTDGSLFTVGFKPEEFERIWGRR